MTFTREGDKVTLDMSVNDLERLLHMLSYAAGAVRREGPDIFYAWAQFINELNRTNPSFTPYEIPAEFRDVK